MKLPGPTYADGIRKDQQVVFKGLDHNLGAGDGELWDMRNLTSDYYPLLATRQKRRILRSLSAPEGIFSWDGLAWVDGTTFYYRGEAKGTVTDSRKTFAALGAYIVILPDKAYYNTETDEFGSLESDWSGASLTFTNGRLYDEAAEANCIQAAGVDWASIFRVGDAVTISGCTQHPENNKTPIIREIDGDKLYFYEYVFTLDGDDGVEAPLLNESRRTVLEARARKITLVQAFRNVEAVESFATSLERSISEPPLLSFLMDRLAFGAEGGF